MEAYKVAEHAGKRVIITLEIPPDALTNMDRKSVVNKDTAKHRVNKALVMKIEDAEGNLYDTATSSQYTKKKLTYTVGKVIEEPSFDMDLEKVCTEGIHIFLTKRVAEFYNLESIPNGLLEAWHDNGAKYSEFTFVNGKIEGVSTLWHDNGQKQVECMYVNGKEEGLCHSWFKNGKKETIDMYVNGRLEWKNERWYENGQKACEIMCVNGKEERVYQSWDANGLKQHDVVYVNGKEKSGMQNCQTITENGNVYGTYEMWYDGQMVYKNRYWVRHA